MTKIEDILPEIRKGRRFRVVGTGPAAWLKQPFCLRDTDLDLDWELEPEPEAIDLSSVYAHFPDGEFCAITYVGRPADDSLCTLSFQAIDKLHAASLRIRGIKDGPEYRDPRATEWYAAGMPDDETRLNWFKKGHRAGWIAYEKARKEKA